MKSRITCFESVATFYVLKKLSNEAESLKVSLQKQFQEFRN